MAKRWPGGTAAANANDAIVGKRHLQTRLRLFLDDRHIVSWINDDCVFGYRRCDASSRHIVTTSQIRALSAPTRPRELTIERCGEAATTARDSRRVAPLVAPDRSKYRFQARADNFRGLPGAVLASTIDCTILLALRIAAGPSVRMCVADRHSASSAALTVLPPTLNLLMWCSRMLEEIGITPARSSTLRA